MTAMALRSFLFSFLSQEVRLPLSCAVTAFDEEDALSLVQETYCPGVALPGPTEAEELSPAQIQARIGNVDFGVPVVRGIWYPHLNNP